MNRSEETIGIDLGGTNLRAARVKITGGEAMIVDQKREPVGRIRSPEVLATKLSKMIDELDPTRALSVGMGLAAMLRGDEGFVANAPNLGWVNIPFGTLLETQLGRRVSIDNDLSAIAWAEHRFGSARGEEDVLCVFVGTGVGGGAITNGTLLRGASNAGLEIGHIKVQPGDAPDAKLCKCGRRGCLETHAGGAFLAQRARDNPSARLLHLAGSDPENIRSEHLEAAADADDHRACELLERAGYFLGQVVAGSATLLNPSCIVLGGSVWWGSARLRASAMTTFETMCNPPAREALRITEATLGDNAGVLGAADLAQHRA